MKRKSGIIARVESPEFPRGVRFILQDSAGRPLGGIHVEYQGAREEPGRRSAGLGAGRLPSPGSWHEGKE